MMILQSAYNCTIHFNLNKLIADQIQVFRILLNKIDIRIALHRAEAYKHLMNAEDVENLKWLRIFNKYGLYSKSKVRVDVEKVKPYYLSLIEKARNHLMSYPPAKKFVDSANQRGAC